MTPITQAVADPRFSMNVNFFDFSRRDMGCFISAGLIHCLLFLWVGIPFNMLDKAKDKLGENLVQVEFRTDMQAWASHQRPARKQRSLMSRMKSFFKKKPEKKDSALASMRKSQNKIDVKKSPWEKVNKTLADKDFKNKNFKSTNKQDALSIAKGKNDARALSVQKTKIEDTAPSLKAKSFQVARKDTPFKISKPKNDALSMSNAVPMNVGRKSSKSISTLVKNDFSPSLKSKSFSSKSGMGLAGTSAGSDDNEPLATSSFKSSKQMKQELASSKAYGSGGTAFQGTGFSSSNKSTSFGSDPKSKVTKPTGGKSPFEISGALRNRKIAQKFFPKVKMDARVALRFRVDWRGRVMDGIVVVISSGSPSFDQTVLEALREWKFSSLPSSRSNEVQEGVITFKFRGV